MQDAYNLESQLELAKLYCDKGEFHRSIPILAQISDRYLDSKNFDSFLKTQNLLLKCHAEREEFEKVNDIKDRLQDLVIKEGITLTAKTYYTLSICSAFKENYDVTMDYLRKSLSLAMSDGNKEDICYAVNGMAIAYRAMGKYDESLRELYNLQVLFQGVDMPEVKFYSLALNSRILIEKNKSDEAIELLWMAYDSLKTSSNVLAQICFLVYLGSAYKAKGDHVSASIYLNLAKNTCDPRNHVRSNKLIDEQMKGLSLVSSEKYDLVIDEESQVVKEKNIGQVEFKNQFILLDLLKLFVQNPGQIYSKEYLVENIWKQKYNPDVHDNKVYVTIKRLRKLIEPDFDEPKYIFRAKNGYFLNNRVKVNFKGGPL